MVYETAHGSWTVIEGDDTAASTEEAAAGGGAEHHTDSQDDEDPFGPVTPLDMGQSASASLQVTKPRLAWENQLSEDQTESCNGGGGGWLRS